MNLTHLFGFCLGALIEAIITPKPKPPTTVGYIFSSSRLQLLDPKTHVSFFNLGGLK